MQTVVEEGGNCPSCAKGSMQYMSENCSCHISPPCGSCVDAPLECDSCGEAVEKQTPAAEPCKADYLWKPQPFQPRPCGKGMITGYTYDGSSGSTMVFTGTYAGEVTHADLLEFFGSGTFGHRFGNCSNGRFTFTKITD